MMDLRWTFLVVSSGKPAARSNRICQPNTDSVPVPVRSLLRCPCSSTCRIRSRYCFTLVRDVREQLPRGMETILGALGHELVDDALVAGQPLRQPRHGRVHVLVGERWRVTRGERERPGQHLVKYNADRVEVAALVQARALVLLRAH